MSWAMREVLARGVEDGVLDVGGEADGVDEGVDGGELRLNLREGRGDGVVAGDVALDEEAGGGLAEGSEELFGGFFEALGLVAEDKRGAGLGEFFRDGVGDRALVGDSEDDGDLALHIDHGG